MDRDAAYVAHLRAAIHERDEVIARLLTPRRGAHFLAADLAILEEALRWHALVDPAAGDLLPRITALRTDAAQREDLQGHLTILFDDTRSDTQ